MAVQQLNLTSPALLCQAVLLVQNESLRGGGVSFRLDELCAEHLGGNLLLRAAVAQHAEGAMARPIAALWV